MTTRPDLLIVGAGPAGVSAAVMATSLGMHSTLIESGKVGGKLHHIGALENMPGQWMNGPQLADAYAADIARITASGLCSLLEGHAVQVSGHDDRAEVALTDGQILTGDAVVVATGVTPLGPDHVDWITAPSEFWAPPLWRSRPEDLNGVVHVLGADRPLGTWLRAHPDVRRTLTVLCPPEDDYKAVEVTDDPRVVMVPVAGVKLPSGPAGGELTVVRRDGQELQYSVQTVLNNLGNRPAALDGLATAADGYCPPEQQHPRVLTAGDLRSARFQRIAVAQGAGAQCALTRYYDAALAAV